MFRAISQLIAILVATCCLFLLNLSLVYSDPPELPRAKGDRCVEDTDIMRRDHMKFLLHQRDRTVYEGIRTKSHSLSGCIDCHVQTDAENQFVPVDAPKQFCETCHTYASVKLDCFECHATTPDEYHAGNNISSIKYRELPLYPSTMTLVLGATAKVSQ